MKKMSLEFNEIFSNLDQEIVLLKNNTLNFANQSFMDIYKQINILDQTVSATSQMRDDVLDVKVFSIYKDVQRKQKKSDQVKLLDA